MGSNPPGAESPGGSPGDLYRLALEASPSGSIVVDAEGRIVLVNSQVEAMFGYSRHELVGESIDLLVPDSRRSSHPSHRARYHADPSARPMGAGRDLFGRRKDGAEIPVEIGLSPVSTDQRMFVVASIVDISARRALEDRVRQAGKLEAIGVLTNGIAHDFNNILLAIVGYCEMVRDTLADRPQAREDLDQVFTATERGRRLVQRILQFGRRDENSIDAPVRLDRVVDEALELVRATLPSSVEIRQHLDPDTPTVLCDETQVHQVVMNLAANAAQAMSGRGGVLSVTLEPFVAGGSFVQSHPEMSAGLHARLAISDTGDGMRPEIIDRVFEPFYTTKPTGQGTGLGLSVIHGIVMSHNGGVEIRSRVGEGTEVNVYLPASDPDHASPTNREDEEHIVAQPHVMYVEDEATLARLGARQLEMAGFRVTVHTSSVQALEAFRADPTAVDLVITDNTMPRMTGFELSRELLTIRPDIGIVMVSGLADGMDEATLREAGIRRVLRKPFTRADLIQVVREAVGVAGDE